MFLLEIFDILQKEWPFIAGAPVIAIGGGLILLTVAFTAAWKLKSAIDDGQIKQRDAEMSVFNARLLLAKEREQAVQMAREEVEKQVQELKAQITAGASKEALARVTARVDNALFDFKSANNELQKVFPGRSAFLSKGRFLGDGRRGGQSPSKPVKSPL